MQDRSIVEFTQVWWSVRPHFSFGTVEVRICDAQATAQESDALAALMVACIAQAVRDVDEGVRSRDPAARMIEENMWRAIRFGLDGRLIDLERGEEYPAREAIERLLAWTAPMRAELGIEPGFPGAQRRAAPAADDRGGRHARGGVRGRGDGDQETLLRGGDGVSTIQQGSRRSDAGRAGVRPGEPSEEELRAAYEAELSRITTADMMLQAAVSLLNIGARRLGLPAAELREPEPAPAGVRARSRAGARRDRRREGAAGDSRAQRSRRSCGPLRDALSQLQMAYAREAAAARRRQQPRAARAATEPRAAAGQAAQEAGRPAVRAAEPGPPRVRRESSGRLWVPGS